MAVRKEKLSLSDYVNYLTHRADRYSRYMVACVTIAIPLFTLLFVLWGLRINMFATTESLKGIEGYEILYESMEQSVQNIREIEAMLIALSAIFPSK